MSTSHEIKIPQEHMPLRMNLHPAPQPKEIVRQLTNVVWEHGFWVGEYLSEPPWKPELSLLKQLMEDILSQLTFPFANILVEPH
jgi:hypothetical protein